MMLRTEILTLFADPTNAYVVLLAGGILVLSEFLRPGRVLPGVAGATVCTVALYALVQSEWSMYGAALLTASFVIAISNLAIGSYVLHSVCASCWVCGSLLLFQGAEIIHPAAALAGGVLAFSCSWLLNIAYRARKAKRNYESRLETFASRNMSA